MVRPELQVGPICWPMRASRVGNGQEDDQVRSVGPGQHQTIPRFRAPWFPCALPPINTIVGGCRGKYLPRLPHFLGSYNLCIAMDRHESG